MKDKIALIFGIIGIIFVLIPLWTWAIVGIPEKIGTAFGVTAMIPLTISFMLFILSEG